ncbi:MAG TPA: DsbA family protein [Longimicrobiaceae bacterium]|nr:DsbA family protein [Longimicrobiaceae bacterium]
MAAVPVTVFSDFACPFSYLAETALRRLEAERAVAPEYRAYELYPAPEPLPPPVGESEIEAARALAEELGVELAPPPRRSRTRKAHEAARLARERGVEGAFRDAVFAAYFARRLDVGRIDVLVALGAAVGLDPSEVKVVLDVDAHAAAVAADREVALRAGFEGVPVMVVGRGEAARVLVGAHPYAVLRRAVDETSAAGG